MQHSVDYSCSHANFKLSKKEHTFEHVLRELSQVFWCCLLQKLDVFLRVEACELVECRWTRSIHFKMSVEAIVEKQMVTHPDAMWLHNMPLPIVVVANVCLN